MRNRSHLFLLISFSALALGAGGTGARAAFINDPTTFWRPVIYGSAPLTDPVNDQQTGSFEGDLVANSSNPLFYTRFDDAGTPSTTDGTLGFRVRVGGDANPPGFKSTFFVGIDANSNGSLDLFVGVGNSGSSDAIGMWNPGTSANTSPSTTSIVSPPFQTFAETATNYHFAAVTLTLDPTATTLDVGAGGQTDFFLSFSLPFNALVTRLNSVVPGFNENTPVRYVVATATQDNSLNQDIGGITGGTNSTSTFTQLGIISNPTTALIVPEPSGYVLMATGLAGLAGLRLRRRHAAA
jgi:hypothetical protein